MSFYLADDATVTHDHDPQASRLYGIDVKRTLAEGDTVNSARVFVDGVEQTPVTVTGTVLAYRFTGGAVGAKVAITFRWTTVLGDVDERTVYLNVVQR